MTLEQKVADIPLPQPVDGEDLAGWARRAMLAAAYVGAAHAIATTPPAVVYRHVEHDETEGQQDEAAPTDTVDAG